MPSLRILLLLCAFALPAFAQGNLRSVELTEFLLWASDRGWGGLNEEELAKRHAWIDGQRTLTARRMALSLHTQQLKRTQERLKQLQMNLGFSSDPRSRGQMRTEIASAAQEIETLDRLRIQVMQDIARFESEFPSVYALPEASLAVERAADRLLVHAPGKSRTARIDDLAQKVAAELRALSLNSPAPLDQWLHERPQRARNVLLLSVAALQLMQEHGTPTWRERILEGWTRRMEPLLLWGTSVGAISGVLLASASGDWSHAWASVPLGMGLGATPAIVLMAFSESNLGSDATAQSDQVYTSRPLLSRFLKGAGFPSLAAFQREFEMRFRDTRLKECVSLLSLAK